MNEPPRGAPRHIIKTYQKGSFGLILWCPLFEDDAVEGPGQTTDRIVRETFGHAPRAALVPDVGHHMYRCMRDVATCLLVAQRPQVLPSSLSMGLDPQRKKGVLALGGLWWRVPVDREVVGVLGDVETGEWWS